MQSAAGFKIPASQRLGVAVARTKGGLPTLIPLWWRVLIRKGDPVTIKLTLTLFSLYRILEFPSKFKTDTITAPGKDLGQVMPSIEGFIPKYWRLRPLKIRDEELATSPFPISKSSASSGGINIKKVGSTKVEETIVGTSVKSLVKASVAWVNHPLFRDFEEWCMSTGNEVIMEYMFQWSEEPIPVTSASAPLGRLGLKEEAAGKVRVFAMVDPYTNWVLKPLHKILQKYLRGIPQDGTFDQHKPVKLLQSKGHKSFWCYDLSAATDRLPLAIQTALLSPVLGEERASIWGRLLTEREYTLLMDSYKYAVGQPMGALSSWVMLALTHHFIVQLAALRAKAGYEGKGSSRMWRTSAEFTWFEDYAVLGDDIVIANKEVAEQYVKIMDDIGVEIGLAKSLISRKGGLEFAKKFYLDKVDCSPIPFSEMFAAISNIAEMVQFRTKYKLRLSQLLDLRGVGYKVKASLSKPITKLTPKVKHLHLICSYNTLSVIDWIGQTRIGSVSYKGSWAPVAWEMLSHRQQRLCDVAERKFDTWMEVAKALGHIPSTWDETKDGLDIDEYKSSYQAPWAFKSLSPRLQTEIAVVLYHDPMLRSWNQLKEIERDIVTLYEVAMGLATTIHSQGDSILFDINLMVNEALNKLEEKIDQVSIPTRREIRTFDTYRKNPIVMARLWDRLTAKLHGPREADRSGKWPVKAYNDIKAKLQISNLPAEGEDLNDVRDWLCDPSPFDTSD